MEISVRRTLSAGAKGVCLKESWLYTLSELAFGLNDQI